MDPKIIKTGEVGKEVATSITLITWEYHLWCSYYLYKLARSGQFYLWIPFSKVYMDILTKTFFEFSRPFEKNHLLISWSITSKVF